MPDREDMRNWKQRSLAAASRSQHLTALRGHLSQTQLPVRRDLQPGERGYADGKKQQSWTQWVGEKVSNARKGSYDTGGGIDEVSFFPGWATRRYRMVPGGKPNESFEVDVFISGYASNQRPPEFMTRSQRAFLRLAKGFASLPKVQSSQPQTPAIAEERPPVPLSRSTEELLASVNLPPRPEDIPEDYEAKQMEALEEKFRRMQNGEEDSASIISRSSSSSDIENMANQSLPTTPSPSVSPSFHQQANQTMANMSSDLQKLHANLESRLQPFWSTALSSRTIRLALFASPQEPAMNEAERAEGHEKDGLDHGPMVVQHVTTGSDGSFQAKFTVPWEAICTHPGALHIAFGDPSQEHDLLIAADILPPPQSQQQGASAIRKQGQQRVPLTHSPVRLISDIDDTVKYSGVVTGARAIFYNVFVRDFNEIIIPGMGEWYNKMWQRGVRFHYVSNGPFELIPVVNEFFSAARLPPGSVRLKSYAGRSLFNGLLSAPATRKRAGIVDVMDNFPDSKFILVGDSGEQDLELYAEVARERDGQVLGIFVRDVTAPSPFGKDEGVRELDDPTGLAMRFNGAEYHGPAPASSGKQATFTEDSFKLAMGGPTPRPPRKSGSMPDPTTPTPLVAPTPVPFPVVSAQPGATRAMTDFSTIKAPSATIKVSKLKTAGRTMSKLTLTPKKEKDHGGGSYFPPPSQTSPLSSTPMDIPQTSYESDRSSGSSGKSPKRWSMNIPGNYPPDSANLPEPEKKRVELQMRVYRARAIIPDHIPLRIFRHAEQCVEAKDILDRVLGNDNSTR